MGEGKGEKNGERRRRNKGRSGGGEGGEGIAGGKETRQCSPLTFSHCLSPSASTGTSEPTPCVSSPSWVPRMLLVSARPRLSTSQEAEFSHNFYVTFTVGWGSSNERINPVTRGSADWHCKWHTWQVCRRCRRVSLISKPNQSINASCYWVGESRLAPWRRQMTHLWIQRCWRCRWPCLWMFFPSCQLGFKYCEVTVTIFCRGLSAAWKQWKIVRVPLAGTTCISMFSWDQRGQNG